MDLEGGSLPWPRLPQVPIPLAERLQRVGGALARADVVACTLLVVAASAIGTLWMCTIPFQKGPDEGAHLQMVNFILDHGRLPVFHPDELWLIRVPQGAVETYATFPPLAYLMMAGAAWLLPADVMWGARVVCLASYVGTVVLTYLIGRRLWTGDLRMAAYAALVVALLPQFTFVSAYVNNDAPAVLLSAALFYLVIVLWQSAGDSSVGGGGRRSVALSLGIGALAGALFLTKYTFYPVAALALAVPAGVVLLRGVRGAWVVAAGPLASAGLVAGWWFARNWFLYQELVPSKVVAAAKEQAGGNTLFVPINAGHNLLTLTTDTNFWQLTLQSFVAGFGLLDIFLPAIYYLACAGFALLAGVGLVAGLGRRPWGRGGWALALLWLGMVVSTALAAMVISLHGEYSPQGRYLFGALVPLAMGLSLGWTWLARQSSLFRRAPAAAVATLAAINLVSLVDYIIPAYYGAKPAGVTVQIDYPAVPQPTGSAIEVAGWSFVEGGLHWRPYDAGLISHYRRPAGDLAVYVDGPPGEGTFLGRATTGMPRRDVSRLYGGVRALTAVGYRLLLPPGVIPTGDHRIYVCGVAGPGRDPTCSSRTFRVVQAGLPA